MKFVESNKGHRLHVRDDPNVWCESIVGYWGGNGELNLNWKCASDGTIEHEFLHALGIWHTQMRWDRDKYVKIIEKNIHKDALSQFIMKSKSDVTHFELPYDYKSVMHYPDYAYSKNGEKTILTLDPDKQDLIGQRRGVSELDIELIRKMYDCETKCCDEIKVIGYISGNYKKTREVHNDRPVYKQGDYCIYYGGHWKVDHCDWLYVHKSDNTQGYMWSKINVDCPNEVGRQWRYYSWQGGRDSGPIEPSASVTCE